MLCACIHTYYTACCVKSTICIVTSVTPTWTRSHHSSPAVAANTETRRQDFCLNKKKKSVVVVGFFVSHKLPRRGLESGERACGCCRASVRSRRLSTHRKAPSCRQLSCRASVDVISGPISLPPIGRPGVTRLLFLL